MTMLIDITLKITPKMTADAQDNEKITLSGHLGTHFDVMDKEFPLEYTARQGIVLDVSSVKARDITLSDVDMEGVSADMFVAFHTGFSEREVYGTKSYFADHPQLSPELIEALVQKGVSLIGVDFAGIRRGKEHIPADQYCADRGVFVIENLCNLKAVLDAGGRFTARTCPMNFSEMTGLPCRVIAEI